ncbi:MAG: daunorubicin resistance protein DrrA family ABC transporter ATP-binding protein [Acidimicrobiia bacterium]|nr:MAG: daunorubicin resistance protein DrrA family ABC transporter ATP-binding protein [Acidimicrobiia bacterium]
MSAVVVEGLEKRYGPVEAVGGIDFEVRSGEIFGFLGPNGAGKTTTIKILCTLALPSAGRAEVAGFDVTTHPREVRARIGLVFQDQTLDGQLTAAENLRFHAALYGVPRHEAERRITQMLELVGLSDRADDLVSTFSGGMARRLEIARGLLHVPQVLFLDEPTVGLDPQTRRRIWEDIRRLRDEMGVTVFLTTHYMDEAEVCDRIAIIDHGRIVALDTPGALKQKVGSDRVELRTADNAAALGALRRMGMAAEATSEAVVVWVPDAEAAVARLVGAVGVPVTFVRVAKPTLDDVFLHFTGRELRDEPDQSAGSRRFMAMMARRRR